MSYENEGNKGMMPSKTNSLYSILLSVLIALSIILRGGWGYEVILLFFSSVLVIFGSRTDKIDFRGCGVLVIACILYVVFGVIASNFSFASIKGICGILFSLNILFCVKMDKDGLNSFLRGIWCGCTTVCVIGLVSYCGILSFEGCVLDENGCRSFQSVIQYANTAALLMAIGYVITVYYRVSTSKRIFGVFEVLFIVSVFLTYSKILIVIFVGILIVYGYFLKKPELILSTVINLFLATMTAVCGVLLYRTGYIKMMFVVFVGVAFAGYKTNNILCDKWKNIATGVLVGMSVLYVGILALFFVYVSNAQGSALSSFVCRLIYMQDACRAIADNPVCGIGIGMWEYRQFAYQSAFYDVPFIHNGFLQFALDAGIITFGCFVFATVICMVKISKRISAGNNLLILLIFILITLHSVLDVNISFCSVSAIFFGCFGFDGNKKGKRFPVLLPQTIICLLSLVVLCNQAMYKASIETDGKRILNIADISLLNDSQMYYELSKQADEKDAINLIKHAEKINPYDYKLAQGGFALSYKLGRLDEMYDYALKWVQLQPLNNEAYEAAAFAVCKLYEDENEELRFEEEKNKLIERADSANAKINKLSEYIKNNRYIDIDNIEKIFLTGI